MRVLWIVFTALMPIFADDHPATTQASAHQGRWSVPAVGVEGIGSHSYSRFSGYAQFGSMRLTGAMVNSEGLPFGQVTTGWVFAPLKAEHVEFFIEPQVGSAITANKTRLVMGNRMLYQSQNWFLESWTTRFPGKDGWTNCEPLADVMHRVYKGLYFGAVTSCFVGKEHKKEALAEHHGPAKRVNHFFGGAGLLLRKGRLDIGLSCEVGLTHGSKNYIATFGSYTF